MTEPDISTSLVAALVATQFPEWADLAIRPAERATIGSRVLFAPVYDPHAFRRVDERDQVWRELQRLPRGMRAVLVLRFYEDLPEAQIAAVLGCSIGTVKSQLSRGLGPDRSGRHPYPRPWPSAGRTIQIRPRGTPAGV